MKNTTLYVLYHEHRHGVTTYMFKSDRADLDYEFYGRGREKWEEQDILQQIAIGLNINFEPSRQENLIVSKVDADIPTIKIA